MKSRITAGRGAIGACGWMLATMLVATPASAQSSAGAGPIIPPSSITGSISSSPPPAKTGTKTWSGEDGGSGHPLMTAAAIRQAAENFDQCIADLWPEAARRRISRESFARLTSDLSPDLRIMDFMDAQPEFTKAIWDYLDLLVSEARIQRGREVLAAHKEIFDAVEKAYGVDRHVITAIWGIESKYSTMIGDRGVLRSTATLACVGRRQAYFRDEFLSALEILHRGDLRPEQLRGSWAGAFGPTQFMPTSFRRFAVDFDGDGRRDVVSSLPDLIASTANNLKKDGWRAGQTWGYEVEVPAGFNYMNADRSRQLTLAQWQSLGIRRVGGRDFPRPGDAAYLLAPAGAQGPAFLMLPNFRAILRYNPADAYALAIGHLADRLRGGEPFAQAWPRHERVLSRTERLELQRILATRGFYQGEADGRLGGKTVDALRHFQSAAGLPADGFASASVLERLRGR
jgi:lytic murein transglycosylase